MTFWNIVQAIGSALGGVTFLLVILALFFNEKLKDWFVSQSELRKHRLDIVREHDRSNTELRSRIVLELFSRKIKAQDAIRLNAIKVGEAANLVLVVGSDQSAAATPEKIEALKHRAMDALTDFHRSYRAFDADLSKATTRRADAFAEAISFELFPDMKAKYSKESDQTKSSSGKLAKELFNELHTELQQLYSEGFEKLVRPK